jgi:16S rRNA processing protein RimM
VGAAHGIRGEVRLTSYTDPAENIARYGVLKDSAGKNLFPVTLTGRTKTQLKARLGKIADRTEAERWTNTKLYISRNALPEPADKDEFYQADLVGLTAKTPEGTIIGTVADLHNFGAGDILAIDTGERELLVIFTKDTVPDVDIPAGTITVVLPKEV